MDEEFGDGLSAHTLASDERGGLAYVTDHVSGGGTHLRIRYAPPDGRVDFGPRVTIAYVPASDPVRLDSLEAAGGFVTWRTASGAAGRAAVTDRPPPP